MVAEFHLLGEVEVLIDGRPVDIGHARQRSVLAVLLVEANRLLSTAQLVERVWGADTSPRARNTLYGYVHRLRNALAGAADLRSKHGGYVLEVDPMTVDLHRFRALVAEARADGTRSGARLAEALGLWRGDAFGGAESPWLASLRGTLELDRLDARLAHHDLALRDGRHAEVLPDLSALAETHPMDERIAGQFMLALHRSGRSAAAFEHYHGLRGRLADELGVDPGPELRRVYQEMLANDAAPAPREREEEAAEPTDPASTLPAGGELPEQPRARPRRGALIPVLALVVLTAAVITGAVLLGGGDSDGDGGGDGGDQAARAPDTAVPAAPKPGGYDFRFAHSSLCLAERPDEGSGRVFQSDCGDTIPSRGLREIRDGVYHVTTNHPDFGAGCMGIPGATMEPGEFVVDDWCGDDGGGAAEEFRLERISGGYRIRAVHSDLCLGVLNASDEEWAPVFQLPCDSAGAGQVFELVPKT